MRYAFAALSLMMLAVGQDAAAQWVPPVGVPMPSFGVQESHTMYANQSGYQDAGNGPYTHYVNGSSGSCSDAGNGTQSQPRCSIPTNLSAGAVVEVHGGPYSIPNRPVFTFNGTASQPVFLRGVDDGSGLPVIRNDDRFDLGGSYFVVENFIFDGTYVRTTAGSVQDPSSGASFAALRNLEIRNSASKNGSVLWGNDLVLMNSHIHHHQGDDRHGTTLGEATSNVWIVDNYFHHNGGDAIQFCHGCTTNPPRNVFIGRNVMHSDRENAVDLKYARDVVVSENVMSAYRGAPPDTQWCFDDGSGCGVFSSGSDGAGMVIGSDGGPRNVWVILNEIYDSHAGIRVEEGYEVYVLGNRIYDISGETGRAIGLDKDGQPLAIVNNVIWNAGYGIDQNWRENFTLTVHNNVFGNISSAHIRLESGSVISSASIENNIFWQGGSAIPLVFNNAQSASNSAQLDSIMSGTGNLFADPEFVNAASGNFHVSASSPAIDAGTTQLAQYDTQFQQLFPGAGSLLRDPDGKNRPLDGDGSGGLAYDIGPFEYGGGVAPSPPTGLTVE